MPLYELFCIAAHNRTSPANLRQLVSSVSTTIHNSGGVVRDLRSLGKGVTLPMRMKANQAYHTHGDQFLLTFDTNPIILNRVKETLRADPLVIRWTILKKGSAIKDLNPAPVSSISYTGSVGII